MGSLALLSKGKSVAEEEEDLDLSKCDRTNEEFTLMVSNPKSFLAKKFRTSKNQNQKGNYSLEKVKEETTVTPQQEIMKKESKLVADSGFDCHFCRGKTHFVKDYVLKKQSEKNEDENEEAQHLRKLEEIKKKKAANNIMNALIVQENIVDDEFGGVEVWSTDSKDEEVRKPTHGRVFVAKEGKPEFVGRCIMVNVVLSRLRGYTTECESEEAKERDDKCFAAKSMGEKINDCDQLMKKV